jgi:hypothetical protein
MPVRCGSARGSRHNRTCSSNGTRYVETPFPRAHQTNRVRLSSICERNRGGRASKPRRTAEICTVSWGPTHAKTDASACACIAVDTKAAPVMAELAQKKFLGSGAREGRPQMPVYAHGSLWIPRCIRTAPQNFHEGAAISCGLTSRSPPLSPFRLLAHAGHQSTILASWPPQANQCHRLAHLDGLGNPPRS